MDNELSNIISIIISILALVISVPLSIRAIKIADKSHWPIITLAALSLDPKRVRAYADPAMKWCNQRSLTEYYSKKISDSLQRNKLVFIKLEDGEADEHPFGLMNLCSTTSDEVRGIMLNVLEIKINCPGVIHFEVLKAFSILPGNKHFAELNSINYRTSVEDGQKTLHFAYACTANQEKSLDLAEIARISISETEKIELLHTKQRAKDIICFSETGYLLKCETVQGKKYPYTLYISRFKDSGYLDEASIVFGRKKFWTKALSASWRAKKCVVIKRCKETT